MLENLEKIIGLYSEQKQEIDQLLHNGFKINIEDETDLLFESLRCSIDNRD